MKILRLLLLPFSLLYAGILRLRHLLYDRGVIASHKPAVPTIAVGNLALGGTGKTPHVEMLLDLLKEYGTIATLSRGHGRKGKELREVLPTDTPAESGDEPLQLKLGSPHARVFVGADRVGAIAAIQDRIPGLRAVILDDALQHRRLNAGLNILLTRYDRPWTRDHLLPAGDLRDIPYRARAAHIVIVTKCPAAPSAGERERWRKLLQLSPHQELFFSGIEYQRPTWIQGGYGPVELAGQQVLLVTGIAHPAPLVDHLRPLCLRLEHAAFPDHHTFTSADIDRLAERSTKFAPGPKMLITTEKDAVRLRPLIGNGPLKDLPVAVIGMRAVILNGTERFGAMIKAHVGPHKAHS